MAVRREFKAPVAQEGPVPAYTVVEWDQPVSGTIYAFDEKTRTITRQEVVYETGYMVFFPKGHTVFYKDLDGLEKAGLGEIVPLINMKAGEVEANKDYQDAAGAGAVQRKIEKRAS
jgi:hypothetical protein